MAIESNDDVLRPAVDITQVRKDNEQRAARRQDPKYVDVRAGGVEQRRYLIADEKPQLVGAWQTCRLPNDIDVTQINAEGFTAVADQAEKVWEYLGQWDGERKRISDAGQNPSNTNEVLERERHQVALGNVPQGAQASKVPTGTPGPETPSGATGTTSGGNPPKPTD